MLTSLNSTIFIITQTSLSLISKLVETLISLLLTGLVGAALTVFWNLRQKQRELDILTRQEFFYLYGEFFAIWKLWNYALRDAKLEKRPDTLQWDLLQRATTAEAKVESILMKLATERNLSKESLDKLGCFRQLYQELREVIRDNKPLEWNSSEHLHYKKFKMLAFEIAALIQTRNQFLLRQSKHRVESWLKITSNNYEFWIDR